jgi:hypothetical protein
MTASVTAPSMVDGEQQLILTGISWDKYVRVADLLGDRRGFRIVYCKGS